jgi:hypothetical protein
MTRTCDLRFRKKPRTWKGPRITSSYVLIERNVQKAHQCDCCLRAAVAIELVFADSLRKTRIFADTAGDCRRKSPQERHGNPETNSNARKSGISGPFSRLPAARPNAGLAGWGGRNRTSIWRFRNRMLLAAREDLQNILS